MKRNLSNYYCNLVKLNLRRLKKERNWTYREMAEITGVSEGYLSGLMSKPVKKVPTIYLLGVICEFACIEIEYFFKEVPEGEEFRFSSGRRKKVK